MKRSVILSAAAALLFCSSTAANAADTIEFPGVGYFAFGDAPSGGLSADAGHVYYAEDGYLVTLHSVGALQPHIGDVGSISAFSWHDGANNAAGSYVTLTRQDGGLFDLLSFEYDVYTAFPMTVNAGAYAPVILNESGARDAGFFSVSSVRFSGPGEYQLDNLRVEQSSAVPEPATWAMLLLGFGFVGGAMRSAKRTKKPAVSYA